jgi:5-formyltetrahydrofolate cyclo-ligase
MVVPPTALDLLRKELRQRRQAIAIERKTASFGMSVILNHLLATAQSVGVYCPIGGEPDPLPLLDNFAGAAALPALFANDPLMMFRCWTHSDRLVTASWGGQQPADTAAAINPDLIFVPVLGFDDAYNRIGQGGGHYDRYLAAHPQAARIGIAWEAQRVESIDAQPWDVPMDAILTEAAFHVKDLSRCQRL